MDNIIFYVIGGGLLSVYIYYLIIFGKGIGKKEEAFSFKKKKVSVIIAARNEESTLPFLLFSLTNQSYPQDLFEIIIADDNSSDGTKKVIEKYMNADSNIKIVEVQNREKAISPKKNALSQAIEIAEGELLLLTDADCIVGKFWIESMVAHFDEETQMVVGFSATKINNWQTATLAQKYEYVDVFSLFTAAGGAIKNGKYFSCSGQNISYKKNAFEKVGGFSSIAHLLSGDDVNLMQLFRKKNFKIKFSNQPETFVTTRPIRNWTNLINQRSRWSSNLKWQIFLNLEFFVYLSVIAGLLIFILTMLIINPIVGVVTFFIKIIADYLVLQKGLKVFNFPAERKKFIFFKMLIDPFFLLFSAIIGQFGLFSWKKK